MQRQLFAVYFTDLTCKFPFEIWQVMAITTFSYDQEANKMRSLNNKGLFGLFTMGASNSPWALEG